MRPAPQTGTSPRTLARLAAVLWLLQFAAFVPGALMISRLVAAGDARTTAANLVSHETLVHLGVAGDLIGVAFYIAVVAVLYRLFKPAGALLSLAAAFFGLAGCAILAASSIFHVAPLVFLGEGAPWNSFLPAQLQALAYFSFFKMYSAGYSISLVFFGNYCLLLGCLILRSWFLPRLLGLLLAVAGLGWLTVLWPPLASALFPVVRPLGILGEGALVIWLLVAGVNTQRWLQQAAADYDAAGRPAASPAAAP